MSTVSKPKTPRRKATGLTSTEEKILKAFGELQVPYFTPADITRLLFKKGSRAYVRSIMTGLAGCEDYNSRNYLYRFGMPNAPGNFARIFSLTRRGRDFLRELGLDAHFWYRPYKASHYSFSFLQHHLAITKSLVALHAFCRDYPDYQVLETRTGFTLAGSPPCFTHVADGQEVTIPVIPDAWVSMHHASGQHTALWIEIDTGTEAKAKFQHLVRERIDLIRTGQYEAYFGTPTVLFCYLVIGRQPFQRSRLKNIRRYTWDLLVAAELVDWAPVFRFSTIEETLYDSHSLFTDAVWHGPEAETPIPLLP